jgi:hypothetical protein
LGSLQQVAVACAFLVRKPDAHGMPSGH